MASEFLVSTGSGNGLLPGGTKLLPEPILTFTDEVLWHLPGSNFTISSQATILYDEFGNYTLDITAIFTRTQWVNTIISNLIVSTVPTDVMALWGMQWWPSASPLFDWYLMKKGFQPFVPYQSWKITGKEKCNYIFMLLQINPASYRLRLFNKESISMG